MGRLSFGVITFNEDQFQIATFQIFPQFQNCYSPSLRAVYLKFFHVAAHYVQLNISQYNKCVIKQHFRNTQLMISMMCTYNKIK